MIQDFPHFFEVNLTQPNFGWCDDPNSALYNTFVELPLNASHERLWLNNSPVYDMLAVVGYNDDPIVKGKGSAIFFHVTETYGGTAGCISMSLLDLQFVLSNID